MPFLILGVLGMKTNFFVKAKKVASFLADIKWERLLFPPQKFINVCVALTILILTGIFSLGWEDMWFSYAAFSFGAYSLLIFCVSLPGRLANSRVIKRVRHFLYTNPFAKRYYLDVPFRMLVNLLRTLGVNLVFALIKAFYAIKYSSAWFGALAVYYFALCGIRLFLVRKVHRKFKEDAHEREWKDYLVTGFSLFGLNITVTGFVVQMIRDGQGYEYPGALIYAMAAYTFYCVIFSIIGAVGTKKHKSPVLSAARAINLSAAGVTVFNLQTAMLAQFGDDAKFSHLMNLVIGAGVCAMILGTAIYMLVRAGVHIKKSSR